MIKKKDVQKTAKKVGKAVAKASEDAYDAVAKAAKPKIKAIKKAAAPKVKEARKAIDKQVAKGVEGREVDGQGRAQLHGQVAAKSREKDLMIPSCRTLCPATSPFACDDYSTRNRAVRRHLAGRSHCAIAPTAGAPSAGLG